MTDRDTDGDYPSTDGSLSNEGDVSPCYQAYIDQRGEVPDVCTIYVAFNTESTRTQWITARGDAFVARENAR
ncbi:DUF7511 domain-containing protein [Natrarchaeobius halalkaliphilus]|uniref:DUF7511 domain-containing protein n=1 Tax=Natrarchaeobius halalkaliphilus TaxID=1679091 RepID=UPI000F5418CE|nr:hypothetical protein [Natrarchaeobius halalkaliphilus]